MKKIKIILTLVAVGSSAWLGFGCESDSKRDPYWEYNSGVTNGSNCAINELLDIMLKEKSAMISLSADDLKAIRREAINTAILK